MNIQSLSICVPGTGCMNKCKFCVSRMRKSKYEQKLNRYIFTGQNMADYVNRLEFARDNNCNTMMITGECEPQQNLSFIKDLLVDVNRELRKPFRNIEIQTTGAGIKENTLEKFREWGICTISLSVSCLVDDKINNEIIRVTRDDIKINLKDLCANIFQFGFNLRLSLNVTKNLIDHDYPSYEFIFDRCKQLYANQVTFRKMYSSGSETEQDKWIEENKLLDEEKWFKGLSEYIKAHGNYIDTLEYGNNRYSMNGISVVVDDDCMAKRKNKRAAKYLILRPDCHLYSKWDDAGSIVF